MKAFQRQAQTKEKTGQRKSTQQASSCSPQAAQMMALQRSVGNRAVLQMLSATLIQRKAGLGNGQRVWVRQEGDAWKRAVIVSVINKKQQYQVKYDDRQEDTVGYDRVEDFVPGHDSWGEDNISNEEWLDFRGGISETHPRMEIYNEQKKGLNKMVTHPFYGEENAEKVGTLKEWEHQPFGSEVEHPEKYVSFNHVTTAEDKMNKSQVVIMPGSKEFGEGFYTTSASDLEASKTIGQEWFSKKQKNHNWKTVRFDLPKKIARRLTKGLDEQESAFLLYILNHSTGYPNGGKAPNETDLALIDKINQQGVVLIFPDQKDHEVAYEGEQRKSWEEYTAAKQGGGSYMLVIGPQQPEYMGSIRQYAWKAGWAEWMINAAKRYMEHQNGM